MGVVEENSIEYKRRAIFTGLKMFLNYEGLMEALNVWQKQYSDKPKFATSRFIDYLVKNYNLQNQRKELHSTLTRLLMAPADSLDKDPILLLQDYVAKHGDVSEDDSGYQPLKAHELRESRLFKLFITELHNQLLHKHPLLVPNLYKSLKWQLYKSDISAIARKKIEFWMNQKTDTLLVAVPTAVFHDLLSSAYVLLCQKLGPVESDNIYGVVIRAVEVNPESEGESPRVLL